MASLSTTLAAINEHASEIDLVNFVVMAELSPDPHYLPIREQPEDMPEAPLTNWSAANLKVLEPASMMVEFPFGVHVLDKCVRLTFPFLTTELLAQQTHLDFNYRGVQGLIADVLYEYRTNPDPTVRRGAELFLRALPNAIRVDIAVLRCRLPMRSTIMRAMRDLHNSIFACWGPVEKRCIRATFGTFIFAPGTPSDVLLEKARSLGFVYVLDTDARVAVYQAGGRHRSTDLETAHRADRGRVVTAADLQKIASSDQSPADWVKGLNALLDARQRHYEAQLAYDDANRAWESRFYTEGLLDYNHISRLYYARVNTLARLMTAKQDLSAVSFYPDDADTWNEEVVALRQLYRKRVDNWGSEMTQLAQAVHRRWKTQLNNDQVRILSSSPFSETDASVTFTTADVTEAYEGFEMQVPPHKYQSPET